MFKFIVILCAVMLFSCKQDIAQTVPSSDKSLKVLSYNVYEGFRKDEALKTAFKKWVDSLQPDVIAFQELNGFTGDTFRAFAKEMGLPYTVMLRKSAFPMGLASKYPISNIEKIVDNMRHGCLRGKILDLNFFVTHLEPNSYINRKLEIEIIKNEIAEIPSTEKILLMGDFNNMSPQDSLAYANDEKMGLVRASETNNPEVHILNNGRIDYYAVQAILDIDFQDTWKLFHTVYEKSAPTKVRNHNNYTRIDYIFVNKTLKPDCQNAFIIRDGFTDYTSDHYPMFLILKK